MKFGESLRLVRHAAGLTQAELSARARISRPNIAAYENGRREPLYTTAVSLVDAAGGSVVIEVPVAWSWSTGIRPYPIPSRLWRMPADDALRVVEFGPHLWWSGPPRSFDLAVRSERLRAYEIVLREGVPRDIESIVDGLLLCDAWDEIVVPRALRKGWEPLIPSGHDAARKPLVA